jgi:hypothetical protein
VVDFDVRPAGGVAGEQVSFFELLFDFTRPLEESSWLNHDRLVSSEQIRALWPTLRLGGTDDDHSGLHAEKRLQYSTPYSVGVAESEIRGNWQTFSQWWWDPVEYQEFIFSRDEETVSGQVYKEGTKLTDYHPKGCYMVRVGNQAVILEMKSEHHKKRWVSAPYHLKLVSGLGLGIFPTAEAARQMNLILAQAFHHIRTSGTPGAIYDKDVLSSDDAKRLSLPSEAVPANTGHLPDGKSLRDAFLQLMPGNMTQSLPWYQEVLKGVLQTGTGAVQFSGALPNVDNRTAHGAEIAQSLANQQDDPQHGLKADADGRFGEVFLDLFREHAFDKRWIPGLSKERGLEGAYFRGADFKTKMSVKAVPGSHRGRSDFEQRQAFEQATEALLAFGGVENAPPEIVAQISELFGVRFKHLTYNEQQRLVRIRLNQLKRMLPDAIELYQQYPQERLVGDPATNTATVAPVDRVMEVAEKMIGQTKPPIDEDEPGAIYAINYLRRWYLTDEGIEAHPLLRRSVKLMIRAHQACLIEDGQEQEATQAAMHPMATAAAVNQQQQQSQGASPSKKPAQRSAQPSRPGAQPARPA